MKKLFLLFFLLAICVSDYASIISDNDGSSLITKPELDSLKSDFQSKIDAYNSNIDSKINVAIISYLEGAIFNGKKLNQVCRTTIEYPLTLRHLGPYAGNDVKNIATLDNGEKLWTDELDVEFNGQRHGNAWWQRDVLTKRVNNRIKNFYNGNVKVGNIEKYKINEMWNNFNVLGSLTSCVHQFSYVETVHESWGWVVLMDCAADQTKGSQLQANTWTRTLADTSLNPTNNNRRTFPTNTRPFYLGLWGQYHSSNTTAASSRTTLLSTKNDGTVKWDRLSRTWGSASNWIEYTVAWANWLQSSTHSNSKLNDILVSVARGSESTETYLPVLYDGNIKVTNIDNSKKDLCPGIVWTTEQEHTTRTEISNLVALHHIIEPGFVVDSENNKKAGTTWDSTSLIAGTRLVYDEVTPYKKDVVECTMGNGILLTEASDKMKQMKVSIKVDWPQHIKLQIHKKNI